MVGKLKILNEKQNKNKNKKTKTKKTSPTYET